MKRNIRRIAGRLLTGGLFLAGFLVFAYPILAGNLTDRAMAEALERFDSMKENVSGQEIREDGDENQMEENRKQNKLYEEMQKYNQIIAQNGQSALVDAWVYEQSAIDLSEYGLYDSPVGVVHIPKMEVELPIYLGADKNNMSRGAAQLGQTSMPIGGTDTNCVLAAHRGYAGSSFFREIERLEVGDEIYIENLWETLVYRVTGMTVISPEDIDKILIQEGKDMVTLITCHPYTRNYQRYVVYCERVLENEDNKMEIDSAREAAKTDKDSGSELLIKAEKGAYIAVPAGLGVLALGLFGKSRSGKQEQKNKRGTDRRSEAENEEKM